MSVAAPTHNLAQALDATGQLVAGIRDEQWSGPTPCSAWDVRALVNHLVFGNRLYARVLAGNPFSPAELPRLREVDQLGADPVGAYRESATDVLTAFNRPDVFERFFILPVGSVPGAVALHLRVTETLVHGWDLAQATGQPADLPEPVAQEELAFTIRQLPADAPRTGGPFGAAQPISDEAPAVDRLAAYLGRPVPWAPVG
jgi:uncharacterized protein (TIGR03086 family)